MEKKSIAQKENRERTAVELSIRYKRQRAATEELHKFARQKGIVLEIDVVAQPYHISWWERYVRVYHKMYVITSKDKTFIMAYDMTSGQIYIWNSDEVVCVADKGKSVFNSTELKDKIVLDDVEALKSVPYKYSVNVVMGIPQGENPDGSTADCKRGVYRFGAWYVMEILQKGHFFYEQRQMTALLRKYADDCDLDYKIHMEDKLASRAKLATIDGKNYWCLRCQVKDTGKVCFVLYDEETKLFDITDVAPNLWVLQQRIAMKKIKTYAKKNGLVLKDAWPFVAKSGGHSVWAALVACGGSNSYVTCRVRTGETALATTLTDSLKLNMTGKAFDCSFCGYDFKATCWLEAEYVGAAE